ncbi:MAG: hypothetical protein VB050_03405 [Geobacteraceae bacterium]|nr:hypothetical protein [Geobacteraceae bacterium]
MRWLLSFLKYRSVRQEQAARAASMAVQLVLNGHLTPPRLAGAKGIIHSPREMRLSPQRFQALIRREGVV